MSTFATLVLLLSTSWIFASVSLNVGTADFCPYVCSSKIDKKVLDKKLPGFQIEVARYIFSQRDIVLHIKLFPWERLIDTIQNSDTLDFMIAIAKEDAPNLETPHHNFGLIRPCFFKKRSKSWDYLGTESLENQLLGVIPDWIYGLPEIDNYIKTNSKKNEKLMFLRGDNIFFRGFSMLKSNRLDIYISNKEAGEYTVKNNPTLGSDFSMSCPPPLQESLVYLGINKKSKNKNLIQSVYDQEIVKESFKSTLMSILTKYGISTFEIPYTLPGKR